MNIWIAVLMGVCVIGADIFVFRICRTVTEPAALFTALYTVQMLPALIFLRQDMGNGCLGYLWLTGAMLALGLGAYAFRQRQKLKAPVGGGAESRQTAPELDAFYDSKRLNGILAAMIVVSLSYPVVNVYRLGYGVGSLFRLRTLMKLNDTAQYARYVSHSMAYPILMQALLIPMYLLPLIGGWNFLNAKKKSVRIFCVVTVLPSILVLFTQNTKAGFIGSVFLFLSSLVTAKIYRDGTLFSRGIRWKKWIAIFAAMALIFFFLNYIAFFLRYGRFNVSTFMLISRKLINYSIGQIPAFNYWLCGNVFTGGHTFGLKTFYSISDSLGILHRVQGIYPEKLITLHLNTNVYTAFRPLIEDFSFFGAFVVLFLFGWVSSWAYRRLRSGTGGFGTVWLISAFYFYILYSFITSPWAYTSYTAAYVMFFVYLWIIRKHLRPVKSVEP